MLEKEALSSRVCGLAEGEGFEPSDLSVNGFQDRRLRPLGFRRTMTR